ncbi:MAG: T9SS type A sorting domain-containing protein [Ferruginibacter sp.]
MKKFYTICLTVLGLISYQFSQAQCNGIKGPNLLGAKGTFSTPFITVNNTAAVCTQSGSSAFNPPGNVGNALSGCTSSAPGLPCSDYNYTASAGGLVPEFTYSILKTVGNAAGGNCLKGDWRGSDHTGDGGYFMAVNGAPSNSYSSVFYQIKQIPVCVGATYEFSAYVINLKPGSGSSSSNPNISFKVNGVVIANSGIIAANGTATWVKVGGSFTATTTTVDLEVVNATAVANGNDLGLDDISINVCESQILVSGPGSVCAGNNVDVNYTVTDNSHTNTWYKWLLSTDGGATFSDVTTGAQATFTGNSYTLTNNLGVVTSLMNGYKYRLNVSTSLLGLDNPDCIYFNDYTLIAADCAPTPVQLTSFTGKYASGKSMLDWQTSQEINSDRFELFRSGDGLDFVKIASIKSAGNSNVVKNYSYLDEISGNTGNNVYYRLKQIDIDGRATFSSIVKLNLGSKTSFEVFPNPFSTNFTMSFGATKSASATLRIQNSTGVLVYSKQIAVTKGNNSIVMGNLPTLATGVYYVSLFNEELSFNGKLQKQ